MQLLIPAPGHRATAVRWQLCACTLPAPCLSGGNPLPLVDLNLCWEKKWLLHYSSKGLDTQGCRTGPKEQPGMCKWWKIINGKALGPKDRAGDCTGAGTWQEQRAGIGKGAHREWAYMKQYFIISKWPRGRRHCLPEYLENMMNFFYPAAFWATWAELCM